MECAVASLSLLLKHLRILCCVPTPLRKSGQISISWMCGVPPPLHLKPYSVHPPLIYLISLYVNRAQLVSTSVALPAELVWSLCQDDSKYLHVWCEKIKNFLSPISISVYTPPLFLISLASVKCCNQLLLWICEARIALARTSLQSCRVSFWEGLVGQRIIKKKRMYITP